MMSTKILLPRSSAQNPWNRSEMHNGCLAIEVLYTCSAKIGVTINGGTYLEMEVDLLSLAVDHYFSVLVSHIDTSPSYSAVLFRKSRLLKVQLLPPQRLRLPFSVFRCSMGEIGDFIGCCGPRENSFS